MRSKLANFRCDEAGAVTVDWVVLTAAIVGLAFLALNPIASSTDNLSSAVATNIKTQPVGYVSTP